MELRAIIRTDIAASAIAHLTLVALIILISEVHPFHATPPETVTVDIVTPEQVKEEEAKAEEKAQEEVKEKPPEPDLKLPKLDITDKADPAPKPADKPQASPQPSPQPAQQKPPQPAQAPKPREANAQPQQQAPPQQQQQPQSQPLPQMPPQPAPPQQQAAPPPAYQAPQPDVTVKYGVMLGLPPELPLPLPKDAPKDDGGDAKDSIGAKLPPEVIAALRSHLRSCAKLPAGLTPTDNVHIKLRAVFATDGTLAREPILIEAPPSAKGVALVKSATSALQNCQPYKMLPANLYAEWKVLDLPFSPRDFGGQLW
jgi:outer membrane biosynthesis protein TonB